MIKYAVRMYHDEPIWFCNDIEELFNSEDEAIKAIEDEALACKDAFELGYMEDEGDFECYKIIEVQA